MNWSVLREIGVDYPPANARGDQRLRFPISASQAVDQTYLIVDEPWAEKSIPFRLECRTLRVDTDGAIIYDTAAHGIDDGYGCLVGDGSMAVLRRAKWELLIISSVGCVTRRVDLMNFSKRLPTTVSCSAEGTFLITFVDRSQQLDIIEIDPEGRLLWYLPLAAHCLGVPTSVQRLPSDTLLVADGFRHAVVEINRDGEIVWQFGEAENPARSLTRLAGPHSARAVEGGDRLVADTRNHRVLVVHPDGTSEAISPRGCELTDPTFVDLTRDGHVLICDGGNARVIELDADRNVVWQFGTSIRTRRWLSYPRSVESTGSAEYLIADTAHDRIVHFVNGQYEELGLGSETAFFWPRCVRQLPSGSLLVADGRHGRIVELTADGQVLREIWNVDRQQPRRLMDPHDVRLLPNGRLLITDSPQDAVFEVDWDGCIYRVINAQNQCPLKDPHSAQQLEDGRVVICDTGHHRVVFVDPDGCPSSSLETIHTGSSRLRMNRPRYLEVIPGGNLLIVDTGHNRVLLVTLAGHLLDEISELPDSPISHFYQPRWATMVNENELVIADHYHHRIVHLRRHERLDLPGESGRS